MFLGTTCKLLDKMLVHNDCMKTENIYITINLNISKILINYHYNVTPKFYPSKNKFVRKLTIFISVKKVLCAPPDLNKEDEESKFIVLNS
jgi:hypothetical protein